MSFADFCYKWATIFIPENKYSFDNNDNNSYAGNLQPQKVPDGEGFWCLKKGFPRKTLHMTIMCNRAMRSWYPRNAGITERARTANLCACNSLLFAGIVEVKYCQRLCHSQMVFSVSPICLQFLGCIGTFTHRR